MAGDYLYLLGFSNIANSEASAAMLKVPRAGGDIEYICIDEERLTRQKHAYKFPLLAVDYCLKGFGLESLRQVDYIFTDHGSYPRFMCSTPSYRRIEHDYIKLQLDFPRERIHVVDHHDAHAASAFYPSGFDEAAVLVVDGFGSRLNTQSLFHMKGLEMHEIERGDNWGIGALYALVSRGVLPYGPEKGYGKVMGLAPYGRDKEGPVLDFKPREKGLTTDYSSFYSRLPIGRMLANVRQCTDREEVLNPYFSRAAYDVQKECERQIVRMAQYAYDKTGCDAICLSGGTMLNGIANAQILRQTPIKRIWIQPAASDTGGPFGMVLYGYFQIIAPTLAPEKVARVRMPHAYTGRAYRRSETEAFLDSYGIDHRPTTPEEVADLLADGKVFAWFEGGAEYGPRALGHRSINADPRRNEMWHHLNTAVKFREGYRPYAPSVLAEHARDWLDLDTDSPFMLMVVEVKEDKRDKVPAITHIDNTTRPQTVTPEANPNYHRMISAFHAKTGVPMVLNTSFNVNKEPIVETPADALVCALGTSIDYLYLDGLLIDCQRHANPDLLARIKADRQQRIDAEWKRALSEHLRNYDEAERDNYLAEENKISEWYRDYRAKYELEKAIIEWRARDRRILVIGTRRHTACLYLYIQDFPRLRIGGFVAMDDLPAESGPFSAFPETTLDAVRWDEVDEVLVSTHEYQEEALRRIRAANPDARVVTIYDTACDSLLYVLPGRWPVINPEEAVTHGVILARQLSRSATSIDFDYEKDEVDVTERYGFAIAHTTPIALDGAPLPVSGATDADQLNRQLRILQQSFSFATMGQLLDSQSKLDESSAVICFDGGYRAFLSEILPVLKARQVSATLFVAGAPLAEPKVLLADKLRLLLARLGGAAVRQALDSFVAEHGTALDDLGALGIDTLVPGEGDADAEAVWTLAAGRMPTAAAEKALAPLFAGQFGNEATVAKALYLSTDDLAACAEAGIEIGIQPFHGSLLARLTLTEQEREIRRSLETLGAIATKGGKPVLSIPFGTSGTWGNATKRVARDLGFAGAVVLGPRIIKPKDIKLRWEVPRLLPTDVFEADGHFKAEVLSGLSTRE